jgi:hypothetical protein
MLKIRNHLVHGKYFDLESTIAIGTFYFHLLNLVQRITLLILGWPLEKTDLLDTSSSINKVYRPAVWKNDLEILQNKFSL